MKHIKRLIKTIRMIMTVTALSIAILCASVFFLKRTDMYIRDRVVMLKGDEGGCSGVQVKAPSGKVYTLSAAHCAEISSTGNIEATYEDGAHAILTIIDVNPKYDLMLLSAANGLSIDVADSVSKHETVHSMTHGRLFPSHRSDGELLEEVSVPIGLYLIESPELIEKCIGDGNSIMFSMVGPVCVRDLLVMATTARVRGGSSGGPMLNSNNELVGIVSITWQDDISGVVPLRIIQDFIKDR